MNRTVAAIAAAGLALAILYYAIFVRPEHAIRQAAEARGGEITAQAQAGAAQDTIKILVDHTADTSRISNRTTETNHEILTTPGADAPVDPSINAAGLRALCLQDGRREPVCSEVFHRDGGVGGSR